MSNQYGGGPGAKPAICYGSPIPPDLGDSAQFQLNAPMAAVSDPFRPCGPPTCPASSCCGGGDSGGRIPRAVTN